jgi:hypothetical protein
VKTMIQAMIVSVGWESDWNDVPHPAIEIRSRNAPPWFARVYHHPANGWEVTYLAIGDGFDASIVEEGQAKEKFREVVKGEPQFFASEAFALIDVDLHDLGRAKGDRKWRGRTVEIPIACDD